MKKIKIPRLFFSLLFITILLQGHSCRIDTNYRPSEKERRKVSEFDAIEVSHGIDVYLTMGSSEQVDVEAAEELLEDLVTEVKGGILKIYFDRPFNWNANANVWIRAKEINMISTSGGVDLRGENVLEAKHLELKASGGSDMKLELHTKSVNVDISGGANIVLSGVTEELLVRSSGGSDVHSMDLVAKKADLEASGGSDIKAYIEEELDARASGGADITYSGNPGYVNTHTSAAGDITHRD